MIHKLLYGHYPIWIPDPESRNPRFKVCEVCLAKENTDARSK